MDFTGQKFGRLTAISHFHDGKRRRWICKCDCGKETKSRAHDLFSGNSTSCGCLNTDRRQAAVTKHGLSTKRPYFIWQGMIARCYKQNCRGYERYGGRGISVCDHWRHSFINFWEDMKEGYSPDLQLDRRDNDGNYQKDNCQWSSKSEQQSNRACTIFIEAFGRKQTAPQWSRETGVNVETIRARIYKGWKPEDAVSLKKRPPGSWWSEGKITPSSTAG